MLMGIMKDLEKKVYRNLKFNSPTNSHYFTLWFQTQPLYEKG